MTLRAQHTAILTTCSSVHLQSIASGVSTVTKKSKWRSHLKWHDHRLNPAGALISAYPKVHSGLCWNSRSVCRCVCVCVRIAQTCLLRFFLFMSVFLFTSYPQCTCPNDNKTGLNICRSIERAWPQQWVHTEVTDESVSASVSTYELCNTKVSISFGHSIFYFRNKKWVIKWWSFFLMVKGRSEK